MKYMGGKHRLAKYIAKIIEELMVKHGSTRYVEPFMGSANVAAAVNFDNMLLSDICPYIVSVYQEAYKGRQFPTELSAEEHKRIKENKDNYPDWLVGFAGYGCSFGGNFFSGYARTNQQQNYVLEASKGIEKKAIKLRNKTIEFQAGLSYDQLELRKGDFIYCDIPYQNTSSYRNKFDHDKFYDWVKSLQNPVLISEFKHNARLPVIWEKQSVTTIRPEKGIPTVECLQLWEPT
jgi:DNA adenine methylase